ncbi:MAG: hypothetical protein WC462_00225 [archaeon]
MNILMFDFFDSLSGNLALVIWIFIAFVVFVIFTKEKRTHDKAAVVASVLIFLVAAIPFFDVIFNRQDFQTPIIGNFISVGIMIVSLIVAVIEAKELHDEK